jgi:hypothetical protein
MTISSSLEQSLLILPVTDLNRTAEYYSKMLRFTAVHYQQSQQPHICLYRDNVEIILIKSKLSKIEPNRIVHGYGYDGYFTTNDVLQIYNELVSNNVTIVHPLGMTEYGNLEFVLEDIDGRWIAIGIKQQ